MKKALVFVLSLLLCAACLSACGGKNNQTTEPSGTEAAKKDEGLTAARDYLYAMYKDNADATPSDYQVVGVVNINGTSYDVEWTADVTEGVKIEKADKMVNIDVDEKTAKDIPYTITATVKNAAGETDSVSFKHTVPAFKVLSYEEFCQDKYEDQAVVVRGVITGIIAQSKGASSNCLYLQDETGGYYVYNLSSDPAADGLEEGMSIIVTGTRDTYSGTLEIINASIEKLDDAKKEIAPADYTDKFTAAASLKDESLTSVQSILVTLKGVEITGQDTSSGYYKFKLGGKESYIRISSSVCPITKDEQATFKTGHTDHLGWEANATGILCLYDGAFYLTPITADAFEYVSLPKKSDAEMVAFEKELLKLPEIIKDDTEIALSLKGQGYENVTVEWASDNACAVVADGKLSITCPDTETKVKITATLKSGSTADTKEFDLVVKKITASRYDQIVELAYLLADGEATPVAYRLCGEITAIPTAYSADYKNITVNIVVDGMEEKPIQCFRLQGEGSDKLAVGDVITVEGILKNYKGTIEFDAKCALIGMGEIVGFANTLEEAFALEENTAMTAPSVLSGTVESIPTVWSEQYKNITVNILVDGSDKVVQCFRLCGEGAEELAVGDKIAVFGTLKNYKGTVEFDSGCKLISVDDVVAVKNVLDLYKLESGDKYTGKKTLTGVISKVVNAWSEEYKNITVDFIVAGMEDYPVEAYRLSGDGCKDLAEGDIITVTGILTRYKDTFEFTSGCTLDAVTKAAK